MPHFFVHSFIETLRQHQFSVGADTYLRIESLLQQLPPNYSHQDLKYTLAPLFATNPKQQALFYRLFDEHFGNLGKQIDRVKEEIQAKDKGTLRSGRIVVTGEIPRPDTSPKTWNVAATLIMTALGIIGLLLLITGSIRLYQCKDNRQWCCLMNNCTIEPTVVEGNKGKEPPIDTSATNEHGKNSTVVQPNKDSNEVTANIKGNKGKETTNVVGDGEDPSDTSATNEHGKDSTVVQLNKNSNEVTADNIAIYITTQPLSGASAVLSSLSKLTYPLGLLGLTLALWFVYREYKRWLQRRLILQKGNAEKPPFSQYIALEHQINLFRNNDVFYDLTRQMRQRQWSGNHTLDRYKTIQKTVKAGGLLHLAHKPITQTAEYLVLIDRRSYKDHQAQYYQQLMRSIQADGIYLQYYFYDTDPRICWLPPAEQPLFLHHAPVYLYELAHQYSQHQLLLIGKGHELLHPITGLLEEWVPSVMATWQKKPIWLSTAEKYGSEERELATFFVVQEASIQGFWEALQMQEKENNHAHPANTAWAKQIFRLQQLPLPEQETAEQIDKIRLHLRSSRLLEWVAACALFPEIYWDLTLLIGQSLQERAAQDASPDAEPPQTLLTPDHVQRLAQLPYFRTGSMPDALRESLINMLPLPIKEQVNELLISVLSQQLQNAAQYPQGSQAARDSFIELICRQAENQQMPNADELQRAKAQFEEDGSELLWVENPPDNTTLTIALPNTLRPAFISLNPFNNSWKTLSKAIGKNTLLRWAKQTAACAVLWLLMWALSWWQPVGKAPTRFALQYPDSLANKKIALYLNNKPIGIDSQQYVIDTLNFEQYALQAKIKIYPDAYALQDTLLTIRPNQINKIPIIPFIDPFAAQMILVKGGTFTMGCTKEQEDECYDAEKPAHSVTLSDFYIGKYEVTQAQWRAIMGNDPPELYNKNCDECPVEGVSWNDIQDFLQKLNALYPPSSGGGYRLPTEAEWEYAARGGTNSKGYLYAGSNNIDDVAWYNANYAQSKHGAEGTTHPVGTKATNELGLYDMSGNVCEWCKDRYASDYYSNSPSRNPENTTSATSRVLRGGAWNCNPRLSRVAFRTYGPPAYRSSTCGFRLALAPQF